MLFEEDYGGGTSTKGAFLLPPRWKGNLSHRVVNPDLDTWGWGGRLSRRKAAPRTAAGNTMQFFYDLVSVLLIPLHCKAGRSFRMWKKKSSLKLSPELELRAAISKRPSCQCSHVGIQPATWEAAADQGDAAFGLPTKGIKSFWCKVSLHTQPTHSTDGQPSTSPKMEAFPASKNFSFSL